MMERMNAEFSARKELKEQSSKLNKYIYLWDGLAGDCVTAAFKALLGAVLNAGFLVLSTICLLVFKIVMITLLACS